MEFNFKEFKKLYIASFVLLCVNLLGVIGYSVIEGYNWTDALYMTIITISTVGFQEVEPLSIEGRYFTSFLIITSFVTFAYSIGAISSYVIDGEFRRQLTKIRKVKNIKKLENHVIVCGYGRNGKQIVNDLANSGQEYLIIENDHEIISEVIHDDCLNYIEGDATNDETLVDAGIHRAKALISTLPNDAGNVFVVLTAREMNKSLLIISRASKNSTYEKLKMAGANNVVMPDKVGGSHMASLVIKPDVVEFFNHLTGQDNNISLEEITYDSLPKEFKNKSIGDLHVRKRSGANIVGLKNKDGEYVLNPTAETIITEGSKLFVLGMRNQIEDLLKWT